MNNTDDTATPVAPRTAPLAAGGNEGASDSAPMASGNVMGKAQPPETRADAMGSDAARRSVDARLRRMHRR